MKMRTVSNENNIKVSIIIPAYNIEKYIGKALESCLEQTQKDIEIIVINDGSTDNTEVVVKEYQQKYTYIRYIKTNNGGLSMARNRGMKEAKGEYIYFLDGDDWIESNTLELCCKELEHYQLDFVTFDMYKEFVLEGGIISDVIEMKQMLNPVDIYSSIHGLETKPRYYSINPEAWRCVFRKSFLEENELQFEQGLIYEDNLFHFSVLGCATKYKYIPHLLYHYQKRENSITMSSFDEKKLDSIFFIANYYLDNFCKMEVDRQAWQTIVAVGIVGLFQNLERASSEDRGNLLELTCEIVEKKKRLINKIKNYYIYENPSVDNYRNAAKMARSVVLSGGFYTEELSLELKDIIDFNRVKTIELFKKLPLHQEGKTIGIYGCGKSSDYILDTYEQIYAKIRAEIIYIDSNVDSYSMIHRDRNVVNVKALENTEIEEIIILSTQYEEQMYKTIRELYKDKYKVHLFYGKDMVAIEESL